MYPSLSGNYTNFSPLNLRNLSEQQLINQNIRYITELDSNNVNVIRVIKWRFDNPQHHIYINEMFNHIVTNNP